MSKKKKAKKEEVVEQEAAVEETTDEAADAEAESTKKLEPVALLTSLLFVSTKPLTAEALSAAARLKVVKVEDTLAKIQELYTNEEHGFSLHEVAGGWQFRTAPEAAAAIKRLIPPRGKKLSRAAAETLAVIAYKQPVDRAEIEAVRGVDALPTLRTLLDGKLVRVVGRQNTPGHPALYGTTTKFLEKFGMRDLAELPSVRELEQLLEDPGEAADFQEQEQEQEQEEELAEAEISPLS